MLCDIHPVIHRRKSRSDSLTTVSLKEVEMRTSNQYLLSSLKILFAFLLGLGSSKTIKAIDDHSGLALLVGCTKYDHLDPAVHLHGPANDVALMQKMLCGRFGFAAARVVMLSEDTGQKELRPTRFNIEREFHRLASKATAGEQVVIFMAGHGSQQPDINPTPDDPEPDGLDEIFLPADVSSWNGDVGSIPNCIVDDEFSKWLKAIEAKGALVTIVMDACHSGTMTRGIGERTRELPPGTLVPSEVMSRATQTATKNSEKTRGGGSIAESPARESLCDSTGTVAIYAAQSTEVTVEKELPADSVDRKPYGLLTYTMNQVLSRSEEPISYRELVRQVQAQYAGSGRSFPTPMIEGIGRDREVFGSKTWSKKAPIRLTKKGKGLAIDAGLLQGIASDSVLAVRERENSKEPIGFVRVQVARTMTSEVVPCEYEGNTVNKNVPEDGWCRIVYADAGDLRMKVAVVGKNEASVSSLRSAVEKASKLAESVFVIVDQVSDANWVAVVDVNGVLITPSESLALVIEKNQKPINSFGPREFSLETQAWVSESFERIGRAYNLKRLAVSESMSDGNLQVPRIEFEIRRKNESVDKENGSASEKQSFKDGEELQIVIRNPCPFAVDATLLYIDQNFEIASLFPNTAEINRLEKKEERSFVSHVTADRDSMEHIVVLALRGIGPIQDFASLCQPGIKGTSRAPGGSGESPLQKLLGKALGNGSQTRGLSRPPVPQHSMQIYSWEVLK